MPVVRMERRTRPPVRDLEFQHEAFFYGDLDEFLGRTVPFLREALEGGEPALVAVSRLRIDALRDELGSDGEQVQFDDMEALGSNPARIIPFWHRFLEERGGLDRPIRGIGEPVWPGRSAAEIDECQRHESLLNYAFWDGPAWRLLCPYDSSELEDEVLEAAHGSHAIVSGSGSCPDRWSGAAPDLHSISPFAGALPQRAPEATVFDFDRSLLHEARVLVASEAERMGLSSERGFDLIAAVGELTANSVRHGGGEGVLSIWRGSGSVIVEVKDDGVIEEPLAGRRRPSSSQDGGRGLWMINQLCDFVQVRSDEHGTAVRVWMGIS